MIYHLRKEIFDESGIEREIRKTSERDPLAVVSNQSTDTLMAVALSNQSWGKLGLGNDPCPASTADSKIMIEQIVNVLELRLQAFFSLHCGHEMVCSTCPRVQGQLYRYVSEIESRYNKVHYHSFEHASHVTLSVNKLVDLLTSNGSKDSDKCDLRNDKFAHFSIVFAALVHDVCHKGVSNQILITKNDELALRYRNRSVAESNSIDVALEILFQSQYDDLRKMMFPDDVYCERFTHILHGAILCTDIASKEVVDSCKRRWTAVFDPSFSTEEGVGGRIDSRRLHVNQSCRSVTSLPLVEVNNDMAKSFGFLSRSMCCCCCCCEEEVPRYCKTFVMLEHMIQVADVAHNMQGWDIFIKWNYRLLRELHACFKSDLMQNPATEWTCGQVSFLDGYVLPLAKRLEMTGFLGVHGASLVSHAEQNKAKWLLVGRCAVEMMVRGIETNEDEDFTLRKIILRLEQMMMRSGGCA